VLTKEVWERTKKKLAILKQLRTHFKAKHEKGVGTLFPGVPVPLHPWLLGYQQSSHKYNLETLSPLNVHSKLCLEKLLPHMQALQGLDNMTQYLRLANPFQ